MNWQPVEKDEQFTKQHDGWIDSRYLPPPQDGEIIVMMPVKGIVVGDKVLTEAGTIKLEEVKEWKR